MKEHVHNYIKQYNSFSGADMVATIHMVGPDGNPAIYTLGSLQTITTSVHMERKPIRAIGNINVKDYVMGPRTIAGTLIFAVFNKHFAYEAIDSILNDQNYNRNFSFLADELPPFDITISFANEYGCRSRMAIYGVRLINEGQVMSINDIYTENTYQYVATDYEYLNDDNGYSNSNEKNNVKISSNKNKLKNKENNKMNGKDLKDKMEKEKILNNDDENKITINCKTTNAKNVNSLGKVKIVLNPSQSTGTLTIFDTNKKMVRLVKIEDFPNEPIYASLKPDQYTVKYQDNSREILIENHFYIGYDISYKNSGNITPTILKRTSESITIKPNNQDHDCLTYNEKEEGKKEAKTCKVDKHGAVINRLKPGTYYDIYTYNKKDKNNKSEVITIKTLEHNDSKYNYIEQQLIKNKDKLSCDIKNHKILIGLFKKFAKGNNYENTVLDSLIATKSKLEKDKDGNHKLLEALSDIKDYVEQVSNNEQYYINSNCEYNKNKQPELIDKTKNSIKLNDNINNIEIYKIKNGRKVFLKSFFNIENKYDLLTCEPGCKHEIISKGKYNELNPMTEFLALNDNEKELYYIRQNEAEQIKSDLINTSYKELYDYVNLEDLPLALKNRMLYQNAKKPIVKTLNTPFIEDMNPMYLTVNMNNAEFLSNQKDDYFLVFSNQYNLFKENIKDKFLIDNTNNKAVIDKEYFVFKENEPYFFWIENDVGEQLSNSFSFCINNDTDKIFINNKISKIYLAKLIKQIQTFTDDEYLKDILASLDTDEQISEYNLYARLIDKILFYTVNIIDKMNFLSTIFKAKFELDYPVKNNFFKEPILLKDSKFIFPDSNKKYEIIKYNISKDNEKNSKINIYQDDKKISIDFDYDYTLLFCQEHGNINIKSGFILVNNKNLNYQKYKLDIKEVNRYV